MSTYSEMPQSRTLRCARDEDARRFILAGLFVVYVMLGGLLAWSVTARIDGAVIAPGTVAVESNRKSVQHLDGGVIGEILVREGDRVAAGQVLLRLDDTLERADLAIVTDQLHELMARRARLRAEIDGSEAIAFDAELVAGETDATIHGILDGQRELFAAGRAARDGQQRIFSQRIASFRDQIAGLTEQSEARTRQIDLARQELAGIERLHANGHAPLTRVLELKRLIGQIEARRAEHATDIARASNAIGEIGLQRIQVEQDFRERITEELRDVQARIQGLTERRVAAGLRLDRIAITAPQSGTVLALRAHTVGGVVQPGETLMEIVPADDALILQAQVLPQDVDKVQAGQSSRIRLSAFDQQTTPEILGVLESVSADQLEDPRGGAPYFVARIRIDESELDRLDGLVLVPGMPAEVFIQTGERLAISYLLKPLVETLARAFKDG